METDEFDVNKKIKREVPWEDELLFDKKVANDEVKSEPVELENQDTSNQEMIEIKEEFGKTMEDFDLSHVKSTSETVDCFDFKSLGCDKSSAHEIVCSNDFQNFAQRKSSIMPLVPEIAKIPSEEGLGIAKSKSYELVLGAQKYTVFMLQGCRK